MPRFSGELSTFPITKDRSHPYFVSGDLESRRSVVFIGGLFNGMGDVPYLGMLSDALGQAGWKLVQLHWTSAYTGFATSSLDVDVSELSSLVTHLRAAGDTTVVLMGHSTGSQDVIHYLLNETIPVDGGILQAPASDREHFNFAEDEMSKAWADKLPLATEFVKSGRGNVVLDAGGMKITAYRLHSLLSKEGDDDYFSSDLPTPPTEGFKHPLSTTFGKLEHPVLVLFSEKDEYVHAPDVPAMLETWREVAKGKLETVIVRGASHAVETQGKEQLCAAVVAWLGQHWPKDQKSIIPQDNPDCPKEVPTVLPLDPSEPAPRIGQ